MSARRTKAASPSASSAWWRSMAEATARGQVPAAGEHAADEGVVDAELAALVVQPLLGRPRRAVHLLRVARVGVHEDELADVVQQRGDEQAVAVRVARLDGEPVGGALDGDGVQAEALRRGVPRLAALEELERLGVGGQLLHGLRATAPRRRRRCSPPARGAASRRGWRAASRRSRGRRRTRWPGPRRRSRGAPRRSGTARGCATRRARGRARAPRRPRSGACRDPRCGANRRARTARCSGAWRNGRPRPGQRLTSTGSCAGHRTRKDDLEVRELAGAPLLRTRIGSRRLAVERRRRRRGLTFLECMYQPGRRRSRAGDRPERRRFARSDAAC